MHPTIETPLLTELRYILQHPRYKAYAEEFGLYNENYFSVDQVGFILYLWGLQFEKNLRLGCILEGQPPQLLSHPNEDPATVVWIHHNGSEECAHYSGVKPKVFHQYQVPSALQAVYDKSNADTPIPDWGGSDVDSVGTGGDQFDDIDMMMAELDKLNYRKGSCFKLKVVYMRSVRFDSKVGLKL